ncbi:MAG: AAA family ATPase [Nitrospira sp. SB0661_bin_20]|nr:AAA family ATPase [Nitrospira sp. SB0661_bin_20]MYJ23103.1 AAA family ATPase [Nitrospira sp. SB0673_bin_12]
MTKLNSITIRGFRSVKEATLEFRPLNVLIGANGAGKSNLISFFKMMNELTAGRLQQYVALTGRATANLYFGPKITPQMEAELNFRVTDEIEDTYRMRLFYAANDSLIFAEEHLSFLTKGHVTPREVNLGVGHDETLLRDTASEGESTAKTTAKTILYMLNRCRVFHFHDTGPTARIMQYCYIDDSRWLMHDAGNLAAVLYRLQSQNETAYRQIVATIKQVAPFFDDFVLEPTGPGKKDIILNWRHRASDLVFGPHQLSDGTLRAICLISLLMQPAEELPCLIIVDEPELGLHPYALSVIASLFQSASHHAQVLLSTQSNEFLNHFDVEDIVVVERDGEASKFVRPNAEELKDWLQDYSLGEVWTKNVIGAGPH